MPKRLDNDQVRQKFIAAGYVPDNDFNYKNNKQKHLLTMATTTPSGVPWLL